MWVIRFAIGFLWIGAMSGCGQSAVRSGVYLASTKNGAPRWISASEGAPVWSPDGTALAWGNEDGITLWTAETGNSSILSDEPVSGRPAWAPDGKSLAFLTRDSRMLTVIDAATGKRLQQAPVATEPSTGEFNLVALGGPSWSPDGTAIAFACRDRFGDELCTIDADGRRRRQLTNFEPAKEGNPRAASNIGPPAWSPDGSRIAVAAYPEVRGAAAGVFVIDLEYGSALQVSQLGPNSELVWTSDSSRVVFSATSDGQSSIYRAESDGSYVSKIFGSLAQSLRNPSLSPDDRYLAASGDGEVVLLRDGRETGTIQLPGLAASNPAWNPSGEEIAIVARPDPIRSFQ